MSILFDVILPVFLVIGFGYAVSWKGWFGASATDGVMAFAQNFAVPCLLFRSMANLDLGAEFHFGLLGSFYAGALACFGIGWWAALRLFKRSPEEAAAIGFACLFSNSLLLGVPITQRAYGEAALAGNFMIIALHSPLLYTFGITVMEFTRARGMNISAGRVMLRALKGVLRTPLVIGILSGIAMNLAQQAGLVMPEGFWGAVNMMAQAALPAALFGLGGVLFRYKPEGEIGAIAMVCALSLLLHPAITFGLTHLLGVNVAGTRSAVMTAAMAPGVNAYLFANMYGVARRVAASSVLVATALSMLSVWFWLTVLP
ncbi:MAG: AEC family transporter [Paracoccus sp. (in: a-proteobacteria)]|uniref:AEC family transporter n=1 Tax=Paracoccus sp. TaxID=267 RepID=UPI0026E02E7F|nr:AEC family transporter [Paracoccus sp. (in: a-proteobacteria)]MDO5621875.1 AEC family transporter [Paracoccus sp. (in: a-proteobacteria)]